jgi:hypothetical protein
MSVLALTLQGPRGSAARFDHAAMVAADPTLVDRWLVYPQFSCTCRHQLVLQIQTLADLPGEEPVPGIYRQYSHLLCLGELVRGPWDAQRLLDSSNAAEIRLLVDPSVPLLVDDDETARVVCYELAMHIVAGVVPAYPTTTQEQSAWQLAIVLAQWRAAGRPGVSHHEVTALDP